MMIIWSLWRHLIRYTPVLRCMQPKPANLHILETAGLNDNANSPLHVHNDTPAVPVTNETRENATLLSINLPPRTTSDDDLAVARPSVEHDEAGIDLHTNLADLSEIEIAQALAHHSFRDWPAKTLRTKSLDTKGQNAPCCSQGHKNLIEERCFDCEIHLSVILGKCTDSTVLHQPGTKN